MLTISSTFSSKRAFSMAVIKITQLSQTIPPSVADFEVSEFVLFQVRARTS